MTIETTHHGPSLSVPTMFIEIGSSETHWNRRDAAEAWADVISDGFGFDFEEDGTPVRIPHIGNVIIGNNVEIGAKNTIARGTIDNTVIANNVKIDDQVHIAHNCFIGNNTIITACVEISGSVTIGENCWIGPNCSIIQKVTIGDNTTIGIGSIITKDIEANKKIMGLESLELRPLLKVKKRIEYGK